MYLIRTTTTHLLYSADLALRERHFFRSPSNDLRRQKCDKVEDLKVHTATFFTQRSVEFYKPGIVSISDHWRRVIGADSTYTVESQFS